MNRPSLPWRGVTLAMACSKCCEAMSWPPPRRIVGSRVAIAARGGVHRQGVGAAGGASGGGRPPSLWWLAISLREVGRVG